MTASDTALRQCASAADVTTGTSSAIRTPDTGLPCSSRAPAGRHVQGAPAVAGTSRANPQNPVMTSPLAVAILGVVTSLRTRTPGRDVPRESREKQ